MSLIKQLKMHDNEDICIIGTKCILVPYLDHHVDIYHKWMKDSQLLNDTASDPLTLEQEYDMQKSWRNDDDKLTFIILDKAKFDLIPGASFQSREYESMCGDINVFDKSQDGEKWTKAELSVMIARIECRRKGIAFEAIGIVEKYINAIRPTLKAISVYIHCDNAASISLFEKSGFTQSGDLTYFREICLVKLLNKNLTDILSFEHLRNVSYSKMACHEWLDKEY